MQYTICITGWPEEAQEEFIELFLRQVQARIHVRGNDRLTDAEIDHVAKALLPKIPEDFEWPLKYANDRKICHLRFMDQLRGNELFKNAKRRRMNTEHKCSNSLEHAWTSAFDTMYSFLKKNPDHPLRRTLISTTHSVKPAFAKHLFRTQRSVRTNPPSY